MENIKHWITILDDKIIIWNPLNKCLLSHFLFSIQKFYLLSFIKPNSKKRDLLTEKFSCHLLCQYLTNDYNYFEVERLRFYHEKQTVIFPSCLNIFLQFFSASCIIINQSKWALTQRLSDEKLKRENNESQYDEEWSHTHTLIPLNIYSNYPNDDFIWLYNKSIEFL